MNQIVVCGETFTCEHENDVLTLTNSDGMTKELKGLERKLVLEIIRRHETANFSIVLGGLYLGRGHREWEVRVGSAKGEVIASDDHLQQAVYKAIDLAPLHKLPGYQRFLGEAADALHLPGSPQWSDVIDKAQLLSAPRPLTPAFSIPCANCGKTLGTGVPGNGHSRSFCTECDVT